MSNPEFPIKVIFEDKSVKLFNSVEDIELNLEDFDSDFDEKCTILDAKGKEVRLIVKLLKLTIFEYKH